MTPDTISAVADVLSAIAAWTITVSLFIGYNEFRSDHERSRREKAIALLMEWSRSTEQKSEAARRLGDKLDFEQAKAVQLQQKFEVDAKLEVLLRNVLDDKVAAVENGKIKVSASQATLIRYYIVKYLNNIEGVLSAWRHNVANRVIIEEQFCGFVSQEDREFILENYRQAAGGIRAYPALAHFVSYVRERQEKAAQGLPRIV